MNRDQKWKPLVDCFYLQFKNVLLQWKGIYHMTGVT